MAASGRTASFLHRSSRVKSPQLILATIVVSASSPLSSVPSTAESFPIIGGGQRRQQGTFGFVHRNVHLPSRKFKPLASSSSDDATGEGGSDRSVTGPIYELDSGVPIVKLFTKEGCTLCDKVKDVLQSVREDTPHSLYAVDITDDDKQEWFSKYKYDIPVLHINDIYWTKHRLTAEDAISGIAEACAGNFVTQQGEPDASRFEHN